MFEISQRYPDPRVEVLHRDFMKYRLFNSAVEVLATGTRWGEGPVWFGDGRYLLWSDIPNDRILRWDECNASVTVFRQPSNHANGNTRDRQGRLVTCEHGRRRVTRTEYDGSLTVLADAYDGKRLNSPNDVIVASDGAIWFTDPPFGLTGFYEGTRAKQELPANVYRIDAESGEMTIACSDVEGPNGLCFSPDESKLYVVASRAQPNRLIYSYDMSKDLKRTSNRSIVVDCGPGTSDGIRCDEDGNLWCGWGMGSDELDGVRVFSKEGVPLAHIHLGERCANICFGGLHRNQLFMAAGKSLYRLFVNTCSPADGRA